MAVTTSMPVPDRKTAFFISGYTVVPLYSLQQTALARENVASEIAAFTETNEGRVILGGFAALGNPSSFHNPTVRGIREDAHPVAKKAIAEAFAETGHRFEQIIDRLRWNEPDQTPSKESWHRDIAPGTKTGDVVFGGWVNLDPVPQEFCCVPCTHREEPARGSQGFAKISKERHKELESRSQLVQIPPGHMLIFDERLVHCVLGTKKKEPSCRLFLGWRLTHSDEPLIKDLDKLLRRQAVMPLKSGQFPRIFPKLYWTNWRSKLTSLEQTYKVTFKFPVKSGADKGAVFRLPHSPSGHMQSLKELSRKNPTIRRYKNYSDSEKRLLRPHLI